MKTGISPEYPEMTMLSSFASEAQFVTSMWRKTIASDEYLMLGGGRKPTRMKLTQRGTSHTQCPTSTACQTSQCSVSQIGLSIKRKRQHCHSEPVTETISRCIRALPWDRHTAEEVPIGTTLPFILTSNSNEHRQLHNQ